ATAPDLASGTTGSIFGMTTGRGEAFGASGVAAGAGAVVVAVATFALGCRAKEKSETSEDENHGTCWPCEPRVTPMRVRLNTSSAVKSGAFSWLTNSLTNSRCSPPVSLTTVLGADEYMTSEPVGASTGARPADTGRKRRSKGLRRDASRMAILTLAPREFISFNILSRLTPSRRTSASVQTCPSTGIM